MSPRPRRDRATRGGRPAPSARRSVPGESRRRPDAGASAGPPLKARRPAQPPRTGRAVDTVDSLLEEMADSWGRGENPAAESFLSRLHEPSPDDQLALIYQEYCLAEAAGVEADPADMLARFPGHAASLKRLFGLHGALDSTQLRDAIGPVGSTVLPGLGDQVGPFLLIKEMGSGAFARVYLAEQTDMESRLVVVKLGEAATSEHRLMARVRHPHVVEVISHAAVDGGAFQIMVMPFLGGATLGAVLEERRRRGVRPRRGVDLLDDLDHVSAPEFKASTAGQPARELISGLSHAQAMAWAFARLAEALDYAERRGVTHGDLKPSNILIAADGAPMLLDFNLAADDFAPGAATDSIRGTPAYMAPEVLRSGIARPKAAIDAHRADLYALGLVLRESLTGLAPPNVSVSGQGGFAALAVALLEARAAESLKGRTSIGYDAGLRSIMDRCLADDPADRYARGSQLAEDLELWRLGLPPAHARESRLVKLTRALRKRRPRAVLASLAVALALAVGSAVAVREVYRASQREQALAQLAATWDRHEQGAIRLQRQTQYGDWGSDVDPVALATRQLLSYRVLPPGDWRQRDSVLRLPPFWREELEGWLHEQALLLSIQTRRQGRGTDDRQRALAYLDAVDPSGKSTALRSERRRLTGESGSIAPPSGEDPPGWLEDYLLGVAAEEDDVRPDSRAALAFYNLALTQRTGGFWAHYRAGFVSHKLGESRAAAGHFGACIKLRPENATLLTRRAGDYFLMGDHAEASRDLDAALKLDPELKEAYVTRLLVRTALRRGESARADMEGFLSRARFGDPAARARLQQLLASESRFGLLPSAKDQAQAKDLILSLVPDDVDTRVNHAHQLARARKLDEAIALFDEIIAEQPRHVHARALRAGCMFNLRHPGTAEALVRVIEDPQFEQVCAYDPLSLRLFDYAARTLGNEGREYAALRYARNGLLLAQGQGQHDKDGIRKAMRAEMNYSVARSLDVAAKLNPSLSDQVAGYLNEALRDNPKILLEMEVDPDDDFPRAREHSGLNLARMLTSTPR
ncbi:protein kinase [Isosphaeraceae bacterium EP7]